MPKIQPKPEPWVVCLLGSAFSAVPLALAGFNDDICVNLQQASPDGDYSEFHKRGDLIKTQTGFFWFMSLYMQITTLAWKGLKKPRLKLLKSQLSIQTYKFLLRKRSDIIPSL